MEALSVKFSEKKKITLPQKESGKRSLAKSDEKSDKSVRKSDRKVTESVPKTKKNDRTPFAALLLRHPEKSQGQISAQGILHLRNPNLGPNSAKLIDLLMGLFRGAVFRHGGGARKQPIKEPTETPTSTLALMGRFPSLMGRFPTLMGRFPDFVPRGRFTS